MNDKQVQEDAQKLLEDEMNDIKNELNEMREKWRKERTEKEKFQTKAAELWDENKKLGDSRDELKAQLEKLSMPQGESFTSSEMNGEIKKIYENAEKYIYMSYPWLNRKIINGDLSLMEEAIQRGVEFHIFYGMMPHSKNKREKREGIENRKNEEKIITWWRNSLNKINKDLVYFNRVDSHCKIILCEKYALVGSQNMMSYRYREDNPDKRNEITMKYTDKRIVEKLRDFILKQNRF